MKTFNIILFALLSLIVAQANASTSVKTIEVTGNGGTKQEAIENAIVEAVRQINGVDVSSKLSRLNNQQKINGKSMVIKNNMSHLSLNAEGFIENYEILESNCEQECEVWLSVSVPVYKSPGKSPDKRRKMAISRFSGSHGKAITDNLQTLLVQSRRFAVLDREHDDLYADEKALLQSSDTPLKEKVRLGQVLGLDYIVTGTTEELQSSGAKYNLTGESQFGKKVQTVIKFKIINLATRQVKWQDQQTLIGSPKQLDTVKPVIRSIIESIYPLKVVSVKQQQIILNQGAKNIEKGSIYNLFQLGEKLIDPYTKESLGFEEYQIGQLEIVRVTSKISYAKLIDGEINRVKEGLIARFHDPLQQDVELKKPTVQSSSLGGVFLPK